ncbi:Peroxiredoxin-2E-2, chloroplastic [Tetrabaena socialis]|uniref:Glutaredoxin-dependent peroxiredoxin n=1 Tax=Tetrabaena socialis TaxID=47790 RepID=A0A2J7ZXS0_9CHLO|nr:Peroxiredoxin-2E-2, chloroplastic [Tetrabaena socialis]|eukprot:PNH05064.1 Peroxiredoxin-2E-2, chloroplastic [Tetrabaena socialis]
MTIAVGDKLPEATFRTMAPDGTIKAVTTAEFFAGRKVVLFAVPGAFTPTCSKEHLPGFVSKAAELRAKGVDAVACLSVNDAFVMGAWAQSLGVGDSVTLLADGGAAFTKAVGLEQDLTDAGLGVRSQRYAMVVEDGTVKALNVEPAKGLTCSRAESILELV